MSDEVQYRQPHAPWVAPKGVEMMRTDMTVIAGAAVKLRDLQNKLAEANQWLPIDGDENATLGELVEENSTGPLRLGYGAWRDLLLGAQFTNGKGELITAGGKTVKNVAGYDLTKFMIGQRGIFGKIATITSRTYRKPEAAILARFPYSAKLVNAFIASPLKPQWMLLRGETLECGYLPWDEASLKFYKAKLEERDVIDRTFHPLEDDVAYRASVWTYNRDGCDGSKRFRAGVPPMRVLEFIRAAGVKDFVADPAFGVVVGSCAVSEVERVQVAAKTVGGSIYFPSMGVASVQYDETARQVLRELKKAFDPEGKLAPLDV